MARLRWSIVGLVLFAPLFSGAVIQLPLAPADALAQQQKVDPATITVYVTKTGEKYHSDGCRHLRQSRIAISLKEAARRYQPCSVCKPPTVKQGASSSQETPWSRESHRKRR
jgi:hypothetical protein